MNDYSERQYQIARQIFRNIQDDSEYEFEELRSLNTDDSPSLFVLFQTLNGLKNSDKKVMNDLVKDLTFPKSVVEIVEQYKLFNTKNNAYKTYQNALIRFSFVISKYFSIKHICEFNLEHWKILLCAIVDEQSFWRNEEAYSIENSVRTFVKVINCCHSDYQVSLR